MKKTIVEHTLSFFNFLKIWSNTIVAIATLIALIYNFVTTNKNLKIATKSINQFEEQTSLQKKSIPAQFTIEFREEGTANETVVLRNTGKTRINTVRAEYQYYFVTSNYSVFSIDGIEDTLCNNFELLRMAHERKLINSPHEIRNLLGLNNIFPFDTIDPQTEFKCEVSAFCNFNAFKIADIINARVFMKWYIRYNDEYANKRTSNTIYVWMHLPYLEKLPIGHEKEQREILSEVIGGQKIIEKIEEYEKNSKEVIF